MPPRDQDFTQPVKLWLTPAQFHQLEAERLRQDRTSIAEVIRRHLFGSNKGTRLTART